MKEITKSYAIKRIAELIEENTELKQQLVELEIKYDKLSTNLNNAENISSDLQQQLADKEKELKYKTAECEKWKTDYENCSKLEKVISKERQYCLDNWRADEKDKIEFAIAELEKVKEILNHNYIIHGWIPLEVLENKVLKQINELKEQKNELQDNIQ